MVSEQGLEWGRTGRRPGPEHSEMAAAGLGQGEAGKQHAQAVAQAERTEDGQRSHLEGVRVAVSSDVSPSGRLDPVSVNFAPQSPITTTRVFLPWLHPSCRVSLRASPESESGPRVRPANAAGGRESADTRHLRRAAAVERLVAMRTDTGSDTIGNRAGAG